MIDKSKTYTEDETLNHILKIATVKQPSDAVRIIMKILQDKFRINFKFKFRVLALLLQREPFKEDRIFRNNLANLYLKRKEFAKAKELFLKSYEYDSGDVFALSGIGYAELGLGNIDTAKAFFEKRLEINNYDTYAWRALAKIENMQK